MKKAIVTGASGFIGRNLVKELVNNNVFVYAVVRQESRSALLEDARIKLITLDLKDINLLSEIIDDNIDVFYHLAWAGSAGQARTDIPLQLSNIQWTVDCVKVAKQMGAMKFVGAGSIMEKEAIFTTNKNGNKPGLSSIYSIAKMAAHTMSKAIASAIDLDHVWAIITNAYGEGELSPRFINTTIRKIINDEPLQFTSGDQNYDFIYIDDVAKALYIIGSNGKAGCEYLIGSSEAKPLKEFILEMRDVLAPKRKFNFGEVIFTGANLPLSKYDTSNTQKDTGFIAQTSFKEGILRTYNWLRENME